MRAFALCISLASVSAHAGLDGASLSALLRDGGDVPTATRVAPLPGISAASFAGFFEVNATAHASLFWWYWPALNMNASAPVIVWLQGGPGSSKHAATQLALVTACKGPSDLARRSLSAPTTGSLFGMLTEIGPYRIDANGAPYPNAYSWTNKYDTVFVDNPRGTGFSYADSEARAPPRPPPLFHCSLAEILAQAGPTTACSHATRSGLAPPPPTPLHPILSSLSLSPDGTLCTSWECYAEDFDAWMRQFVAAFNLQGRVS